MALVVETVRRVRGYQEPAGSFATEGSIGSFWDLPIIEDSFKLTLDRPMETPGIVQQHPDGYPTKVFMPRSATADFALNLQALAARAGASTAVTQHALGKLIEVALGGYFAGTGTTVNDASATTTVIILASATNFREGGAIGFATGAGGALEFREIKTISTNTITLKLALSAAPANASVAYACCSYYLDNTDGSTVKSLQLAVEGLDDNDRWLLKGGQLASTPTMDLTPGKIPRINFAWRFADWDYADGTDTTMNLTSAAISDQALASTGINALADSELLYHTHGSSTRNTVDAPQLSIAPNIMYGPHTTPAGSNTVKQWVRLRSAPAVTGDFVIPHDATTWRLRRDAETRFGLFLQVGSSVTGGGILITVPHACLDDWQREGIDGIAGERMRYYGRLDNQTTTNSNNLQKSAFRVHFF